MLIALDFDETYTRDEAFWNDFIRMAISKGHEVICATMRHEYEGAYLNQTIGKLCKIIYTRRKAKKDYLAEQNIYPDIWIDDKPYWILNDSR